MRIGTCHFISTDSAVRYYAQQGSMSRADAVQAVAEKILAGEIQIGRPPERPGERVYTDPVEGRYYVADEKEDKT